MCSQIEFWCKGLIWNNGGQLPWTGIRECCLFSMSKAAVSLNVSVVQVGGVSVSLTSLSGGTMPSLGSMVQRTLCACKTRLQVNCEDILGFSFCTCQSPHTSDAWQLQNSTSETNIIFLNQSSWVFVGFSFFQKAIWFWRANLQFTFECSEDSYIFFIRWQLSSLTNLY